MYNVTLWHVRITIVAVETQQCILCVVGLHVTVNYIKILSVAQQCFYSKVMLPAKIKHIGLVERIVVTDKLS